MFNKKLVERKNKEISDLQRRIHELEDLICPFNQHEYIEIEHIILTDCDSAGNIDSYCLRTLQCKKCRKIVRDSDKIGYFKYKTIDEVEEKK